MKPTVAKWNLKDSTNTGSNTSLEENNALSFRDLKEQDVARFKAGLPGLVKSKSSLYEMGLSVQERNGFWKNSGRSSTTYLLLVRHHRISLMRGEQVLKSYPVTDAPPKAFGGTPGPCRLSSELFPRSALPTRNAGNRKSWMGNSNGTRLRSGTSVRSNALGEYVMFTREGLILHGPPRDEKEHQAFPHHCLELSLSAAGTSYRSSFNGTKIFLARVNEEAAPPAKTR